jgi:trans-aconitate methyltransferase
VSRTAQMRCLSPAGRTQATTSNTWATFQHIPAHFSTFQHILSHVFHRQCLSWEIPSVSHPTPQRSTC